MGLIQRQDICAFEPYRPRVGTTIEAFAGCIRFRGKHAKTCRTEWPPFDAVVERQWDDSPAYQALSDIRSQAMRLTLFVSQ
jgi:uncharacterized protein (DUF1330 family)